MTPLQRILPHPISHVGYSVADTDAAIAQWAALGVGPFFVAEDVVFEELVSDGRPAVFDHTASFAWLGDTGLELHEIKRVEPATIAETVGFPARNAVNHVAYDVDDPAATSKRLTELGMPEVLYLRLGPVEDRVHRAPLLGHTIELHQRSEFLTGFWQMVKQASDEWDGSDPRRPMPLPPS